MKTRVLVALLLLAICTAIYASEESTDAAGRWRKTQELNQMAERFKAETGFTGKISNDTNRMCLGYYEGKFADIHITAEADTASFRSVFEQILDKVLPYTYAKREQLASSKITNNLGRIKTIYYQQVNGYRVEGAGKLSIVYETGRKGFAIGNGTVDLPDDVQVNIARERAISIAIDYFKDQINPPEHKLVPYVIDDLRFHNPDKMNYSLKYIIYLGDYVYYVDASTGRLDWDNAPGDFLSTFVIKGKAYDPYATSLQPSVLSDSLSMQQIQVNVDGISQYTDDNGEITFQASAIDSFQVNLRSSEFYITDYSDSTKVFYSDSREEYVPNSNIFTSLIGDVCKIGTITKLCYGSNTYMHTNDHISELRNRWGNFEVDDLKIVANFIPTSQTNAGQITYNPPVVRIKTGLHGSIVRHELSHLFTYQVLGNNHFNTTLSQGRAMTEALANYLSCSTVGSPYMIYPQPNGSSYDILNLSVPAVNPWSLNEEGYSNYFSGIFLASAWWSLRDNDLFPPGEQGNNGVDTLLVHSLNQVKEEIPQNNAYRYKPRYFYNILMNRVGDDDAPYPLNLKQEAIRKAYESRGFHFYPKVESYSVALRPRNSFSPGDEVHVNITEAPQNTAFKVYVIKHDEYTYVNGALVSTINDHLASDFMPITGSTDANGRWNGAIWTIPAIAENAIGNYDIIVDFGIPEIEHESLIHYAFTAADVMDGFDGRTEPGFKVIEPPSIDIVLALDCSPSMTDRTQLARTARQFVAQLQNGDRVGVFGFAAEVDGQYLQDVTIKRIPSGYFGLTPILNNKDYLCGHSVITFPATYPYNTYSTDMRTPFVNGYLCFDEMVRPKHFVTLSDGWHCLPNGTTLPDGTFHDPTDEIHDRLLYSYVPYAIQCHTMRYKSYPTNNNGDYPYNEGQTNTLMNSIAEWGNGSSWSRKYISENYQDINAILDEIRQSSSSIDENRSYTGPNPAQDTESIQFVVDKNAHSLTANISINRYCTESTDIIDFSLLSPSGVDVTQNPDNYEFYTSLGRAEITFPDEGVWEAVIVRPPTSTFVASYSFSAQVQSDLEVHFSSPPRKHDLNKPLHLSVEVKDYLNPVTGADVRVCLVRDDWSFEIILFDDGFHNDGQADDGVYSNYFYAYAEVLQEFPNNADGMYDLLFEINAPSLTARRVKRYRIEMVTPEEFPYSATGRSLHPGWNWVGYPRLQRDGLGESIEYANLSLVPYLHDILHYEDSAQYSNNHWTYYGLESLKSPAGYKLRINSTEDVKLYELGTIVDTLMVHPLYRGQWHWYTYPCYERAVPQEALLGAINSIDYIMAERWSMKKENGEWIVDGIRPHLKYGDSIMIHATRNSSFVWNSPLTTPDIVELQKPIHFTFEDKPDYETIMIESIEGNQEYSEIGVFQDDECIGARVIQAYPIQILAYSTPPEEGGGNLSFLLYSENKAVVTAIPSSDLYEINTDPPHSLAPEHYGFRSFSLVADNEQLPVTLALHSNYPNPFNPSTTISFSIPTSSKVKLTVYNIRGQKVRELSNCIMERGQHSIQWDGRDHRNSPVSSGLYFAQVVHERKSRTIKMMLMK